MAPKSSHPPSKRAYWRTAIASGAFSAIGLDLRQVARRLSRSPLHGVLAVLSLAFGLAATLTVLATISAVFWRPIPGVPSDDRLVNVKVADGRTQSPEFASHPDYLSLAALPQLEVLAGFHGTMGAVRLSSDADPQLLPVQAVSTNYFQALQVSATRGRFFQTDEVEAARTLVISEEFWRERFGAEELEGRLGLWINDELFEVVGVAGEDFRGHFKGFPSDLYVPFGAASVLDLPSGAARADRAQRWVEMVGRVAPSVSLDELATAVEVANTRLVEEAPVINADLALSVERLTGIDADFRSGLMLFTGALLAIASLLLAAGCLNCINMTLARSVARRSEFQVRAALGAPRWRTVRLLALEAAAVAVVAAGLALALTRLAGQRISSIFSSLDGRIHLDVTVDARTVFAAAGLVFLLTVLSGVLPGVGASRMAVGLRGRIGGGQRGRRALVVVQVALSFAILVSAALFARALQTASALDPGFRTAGVWTLPVDVDLALGDEAQSAADRDQDSESASVRQEQFLERLEAVSRARPGIGNTAYTTRVPLSLGARFFANSIDIEVPGEVLPEDERGLPVEHAVISDGYFDVLGIDLLAGRSFSAIDQPTGNPVVVVSRAFLERFEGLAGAESASNPALVIGRSFRIDGVEHSIVGVSDDIRVRRLDERAAPMLYLPLRQNPRGRLVLLAAARGEGGTSSDLGGALQTVWRNEAPGAPVPGSSSLQDLLGSALLPQRIGAAAAGALGLVGLMLAAIGLFGVLSHWVLQRRSELGLRMSLGASPREVLRMVLGQGVRLVVIGIVVAVPLSIGAATLLSGLLYGLSPADPLSYVLVAVSMLLCAAAAAWLPARLAASTDPIESLRAEG